MTPAEQEYLKQVYLYSSGKGGIIHTKKLADLVGVNSASATDIIKRLAKKKLLIYNPYYGCRLSKSGKKEALQIVRRHRIWELFLSEKLYIDWKEIHPIATHLQSLENDALIEKLSLFLRHPVLDPHGEPITDKNGHFQNIPSLEILDLKIKQPATIFGYRESGKEFLEYLEKLNLLIGSEIQVISMINYDHSLEVLIENKTKRVISKETAQKIYVRIIEISNLK
jgi:DtxR family Mn-dependent transcriptional regulator